MMFVYNKKKDLFELDGYRKKFLWLPVIVKYDEAIVFAWLRFVWTRKVYKGLWKGYVNEYVFVWNEKNK